MRGRAAYESASQARSMSSGVVRQSAAMIGRRQVFATSRTAAKSSSEAMGNPASMTSTPSASSCRAILNFSSRFMLHPGDRSEEHTSELQSLRHLVCRLLLEKKNKHEQTEDIHHHTSQ